MTSNIRAARTLRSLAFASLALAAVPAFSFTIDATWGTGSQAFTSAQQADIQSAINFYEATFTNNITVNITFDNMTSGLGQSSTGVISSSYSSVHAALIANASGSDDAAALAQLAADPVSNNSTIEMSTANGKALGLYSSNSTDGIIGLNAGICFSTHNSPVAGQYDLYAVACHEMDEVLGTVSGVDGDGNLWTADLYRYNGSGQRSFTTNTSQHAYFSIDGSTLLDEYNQFGRTTGDWGDWAVHNPGQVQDWEGSTGETINPNTELRLLDVVGYTRTAAPEPVSTTLLAAGAFALLRRRRKN